MRAQKHERTDNWRLMIIYSSISGTSIGVKLGSFDLINGIYSDPLTCTLKQAAIRKARHKNKRQVCNVRGKNIYILSYFIIILYFSIYINKCPKFNLQAIFFTTPTMILTRL